MAIRLDRIEKAAIGSVAALAIAAGAAGFAIGTNQSLAPLKRNAPIEVSWNLFKANLNDSLAIARRDREQSVVGRLEAVQGELKLTSSKPATIMYGDLKHAEKDLWEVIYGVKQDRYKLNDIQKREVLHSLFAAVHDLTKHTEGLYGR